MMEWRVEWLVHENFSLKSVINVILMPISAKSIKLSIAGKVFGTWVALASIFVPTIYILSAVTSVRPVSTHQLLIDPGPRHRCYHFSELSVNGTDSLQTNKSISECGQIPGYGGCPTWQYSSFNDGQRHEDLVSGGNGSLINVTLINNAKGVTCNLTEVSFDYLYPGCAIEKLPNRTQYNLLDFDQWIFEYDVTVRKEEENHDVARGAYRKVKSSWNKTKSEPGEAELAESCDGKANKYLSTNFIYQWPDPGCARENSSNCPQLNNTISIVYYSPLHQNFTQGPYQTNEGYGIRLRADSLIKKGVKTHIALDSRALFDQYQQQLCHGGQKPPWLHVSTIRIVSGTRNMSSIVDIQNVQATLKTGQDTSVPLVNPADAPYPIPSSCAKRSDWQEIT